MEHGHGKFTVLGGGEEWLELHRCRRVLSKGVPKVSPMPALGRGARWGGGLSRPSGG